MHWNLNLCVKRLNDFLTFVKEKVMKNHDECIYEFEFTGEPAERRAQPEWRIHMTEITAESPKYSECKFLRNWYIKEMSNES